MLKLTQPNVAHFRPNFLVLIDSFFGSYSPVLIDLMLLYVFEPFLTGLLSESFVIAEGWLRAQIRKVHE